MVRKKYLFTPFRVKSGLVAEGEMHDGIELEGCPRCDQGRLMPQLVWWRYFFGGMIAPGIAVVLGRPNWYSCSHCGYKEDATKKGKFYTKIWMIKGASDNSSYTMASSMSCLLI